MRKTALVAGVAALALAGITLGVAKRAAKRALGQWNGWRRESIRRVEPPFSHLAASQVGYGPSMRKEFTSPRRFGSFRVVAEPGGAVAFAGGPPVRAVHTDVLGDIETVWIGDFTALATPGRYHVVTDDGQVSFPFDVAADVFDPLVRAVQRSFYYQRAFTAVDAAHAEGPWVHPSDADRAPPGVRAGWHDAGDYSLYSASLGNALFWLLEAYSDFAPASDQTNIPESSNGVPDLLDEARWGLEWLLSVQDASGGFRNTTCQEGYGPYGTNAPDRMPPYKNGEVGTLATARAVALLAYASAVFRPHDAAFANRSLQRARAGYAYLREHWTENTDGPTCPAYRADGNADVGNQARMFAAAGMLLATSELRFRDDFEQTYVDLDYEPIYLHLHGFAAQLYLRAPAGDPARKAAIRQRLRHSSDRAREEGEGHPFQLASRSQWGTIGAGFTRTGLYSVKRCLEDPVGAAGDCDQALANVHYALGRNSLQLVYVNGLPGVTRGRAHAFHQWLAVLRADPYCFPGTVAGGPNGNPEPDDVSWPSAWPIPIWGYWGDPAFPRDGDTPLDGRFTDNDSWSTNEVAVDWQASALYSFHFARWMAKGRPAR
jgi:endoglucanase